MYTHNSRYDDYMPGLGKQLLHTRMAAAAANPKLFREGFLLVVRQEMMYVCMWFLTFFSCWTTDTDN